MDKKSVEVNEVVLKEVKATNCPGLIYLLGQEIEIYFSCEKNRVLAETLDEFRKAVKRGKDWALRGCTIVFCKEKEMKHTKILLPCNSETAEAEYVRIYVQPPIKGSNLMIVKREELLLALDS